MSIFYPLDRIFKVNIKKYKYIKLHFQGRFTYSECSRVEDVTTEQEESATERELVAKVGDDGETSDQADAAVDYHTQTAKEHRTESVPVAS